MKPPGFSQDAYQAWRLALASVAELLLLANSADQAVYAHLAAPEEWHTGAMTISVGTHRDEGRRPHDMQRRLKIRVEAGSTAWDQNGDAAARHSGSFLVSIAPLSSRPVGIATRLARHMNLELAEPRSGTVQRSWGETWARMFAASVDTLSLVTSKHPWLLQTSYREGAGYYLHFDPCGVIFEGFYLNEAGYLSCNRDDHRLIRDIAPLDQFDLKQIIAAGASRTATRDYLLSAIQPMISHVESAGPSRGLGR